MGQDAVGAFAAHRIAAPTRRMPRNSGRHALVVIGVVVLLASFAGMLVARV
jgi:hypothetical protein